MNEQFEKALQKALEGENEALRRYEERGGTTATVALLIQKENPYLYLANVGDSRSILAKSSKDGHLIPIRVSRDHNLKDRDEKERLLGVGCKILRDRVIGERVAINMTRALGDFDFKKPKLKDDWISAQPSILQVELTPEHHFLVLASDGLWTEMEDADVVEFVKNMRSKGHCAKEIVEEIVRAIGNDSASDNITVILVIFHWRNGNANDKEFHGGC